MLSPIREEPGVNTPLALTPFPDHVPPDGVPVSVKAGCAEHTVWEAPADTVTDWDTETTLVALLVQPFEVKE
jgi:hypothetical protein